MTTRTGLPFQTRRFQLAFYNASGALANPTGAVVRVVRVVRTGVEIVQTLDLADLTAVSTGIYTLAFTPGASGKYAVRVYSVSAEDAPDGNADSEIEFTVPVPVAPAS